MRENKEKEFDKAYKVLASQYKISNNEAKKLIDRGLVYIQGRQIKIARAEVSVATKFKMKEIKKVEIIFEDKDIVVFNKPAFLNSDEVVPKHKDLILLHRLDRETSGVLMVAKNTTFQKKVISEFNNGKVYKEYVAWVEGILAEPIRIEKKLTKIQQGGRAITKTDKNGKRAVTHVAPLNVSGKKTKIQALIETGRTHQIRVHLKSIGFPIVGDSIYGGPEFERLLLHSKKIKIFDYIFTVEEPSHFSKF
jgi:23S rRNA pseudouridine1911/1915/1917 synthase